MADIYTHQMTHTEEDGDDFVKSIQVGDYTTQFRFVWPVASYEQYITIERFYDKKAKNDPLVYGATFDTDYSYLVYYLKAREAINKSTSSEPYREWIDSQQYLPRSIYAAPPASQVLLLQERINECTEMEPVISQYLEVLKWQFRMSCNDQITVGTITPGGWYRNQDNSFAFRFVTELENVGHGDINNVTLQFEVYK